MMRMAKMATTIVAAAVTVETTTPVGRAIGSSEINGATIGV